MIFYFLCYVIVIGVAVWRFFYNERKKHLLYILSVNFEWTHSSVIYARVYICCENSKKEIRNVVTIVDHHLFLFEK